MKKLLFVNVGGSVTDRTTWSGIPFSLYKGLSKYFEVEECCINSKKKISDILALLFRRYICKEKYIQIFKRRFSKRASGILQHQIDKKKYDAIFVIGSSCIAHINTTTPIVYFTDSCFSQMVNYYWFGLKEREIMEYNETQRLALENSDKCIFASQWAKKAAVNDYGIDETKLVVYHFGSNIEAEPLTNKEHECFNLLFIGVDLKRKGIDVAIECVKICNQIDSSHQYVLHIVGGEPEGDFDKDIVKIYGFLNRNIEEERNKIEYLRSISDIFIMPTRAECAGIVFCEAAAYGIPSISYDTGGVSDYVQNGQTGYLLEMGSNASDFADKVIYLANNHAVLNEMKKSARKLYENDLNWDKLASSINYELNRLIDGP